MMAVEGLSIETGALHVAQNSLGVIRPNIASINKEGYARLKANLEENVLNKNRIPEKKYYSNFLVDKRG